MKIAIHHRERGFSSDWIDYCKLKPAVEIKIVDCYSTDVIDQIKDCDALMWHFHHANSKDVLFAKELIYSLQPLGKVVFPDFYTAWHFDDKVGQKYLLESSEIPMVPAYVFYEHDKALKWVENATFPKVFKLRRGASSARVKLVETRKEALKLVKRAFKKGFSQYEPTSNVKERLRKYVSGQTDLVDVVKGLLRFGYTTDFDWVVGNERGYIYFQDFIPGKTYDIRVVVIDGKAFGMKRFVRKGDFRASGSGYNEYGKEHFNEETIRAAFRLSERLKTQSLAIDFVYDNTPKVIEISYGYDLNVYRKCEGYWDRELNWHKGSFNPQNWMVDMVLKEINRYKMEKTERTVK